MKIQSISKVKIFVCHVPKDDEFQVELKAHLRSLQRPGYITTWFDRDISAGADQEKEREIHLDAANIILVLVSPDLLDSDYWYNVAMVRALKRHQMGTACVIPIILRPVLWEDTPIGGLPFLPAGKKAVNQWANRDEAWENVAQGVRVVVRELLSTQVLSPRQSSQPGQTPVPVVPPPLAHSSRETRVLPPTPSGQPGQSPFMLPSPSPLPLPHILTLFARKKILFMSVLAIFAVFTLVFMSVNVFPLIKLYPLPTISTPFLPTQSPTQSAIPVPATPSSQLLNATTTSHLKEKWTFQTNGPVDFSPVEANGIIYVSSGNNGQSGGYLYAFVIASGQQKWPPVMIGGTVNTSPSAPIVAGGVVYVTSSDGDLYALNAVSGKPMWTFPTQVIYYRSPPAPVVAGGVVYVTSSDGKLHALDAVFGKPEWAFPSTSLLSTVVSGAANNSNFFMLSAFTVVGNMVYVGAVGGALYALDAASGSLKWTSRAGSQDRSKPTLFVVVNSTIYTAVELSDPNLYVMDIVTGKVKGSSQVGDQVNSEPTSLTVSNTIVYAGSSGGEVYAFDATLTQQKWRWTFPIAGHIISSLTVVNNIAYVASWNNGGLYAIDTTSGQTKWPFLSGTGLLTVVNGVVYVGDSGGDLDALDASSGQQKGSFSTGAVVNTSPIVIDNGVYGCSNNEQLSDGSAIGPSLLYAFTLPEKSS